jgi:IS605 OrfB family transposase
VKLSTGAGRIDVGFTLPDVFSRATEGSVCTADLIHRDGRFWLHVVIDLPAPEVAPTDVSVGVDLGLSHPAVTSEGGFLGKKHWKEVESRIFRRKRQLQSKGSKSARRRLRILRGKQARFRRDCDHILSKQIVEGVGPGGRVILENLKDIRSRVRQRKGQQQRRLHAWSFAQLRHFVCYKSECVGVRVTFIDPRHTSQTCSRCGHQHRSNRRSQSLFKCRKCSFMLNADLNAARNVRDKYLASLGKPLAGRPLSTGPTSRKAQCGGAKAATCKPSR